MVNPNSHPRSTARQTTGRNELWFRHCRQIPRAYDVEGAYERQLQNVFTFQHGRAS